MQIPPEVTKCAVFIGFNFPNEIKYCATGFIVGVSANESAFDGRHYDYLVTAKHVIDGIKEYYEAEKTSEEKRKIILRINDTKGSTKIITTEIKDWIFHPTDESVDAAVIPLTLPEDQFDAVAIMEEHALNDEKIKQDAIGSGDDVFFTGLFSFLRIEKQRNLPIIRTGIISLMPEEKVLLNEKFKYAEGYLIEFRSIGGLSGSPAFIWTNNFRKVGETTHFGPPSGKAFHWLGLVHGHWNTSESKVDFIDLFEEDSMDNDKRNVGIAFVVPANKILEIINRSDLKEQRSKAEKDLRNRNATRLD